MQKVKYLTKADLVRLNNLAIKNNSNRAIQEEFVNEISDDLKMPISTILPHNDVEWRIKIVMTNPFEPSTTITDADGNELEGVPTGVMYGSTYHSKELDKLPEYVAYHD